MAFPFITAEQAAELVNNGDNVGFSGFTAAGTPKFVAPAIAAKAKKEHEAGRPFKINVFTGASTNDYIDGELARADAVNFRTPYQSCKDTRARLNAHEINYCDMHLSQLAQNLRYGFFGKMDMVVIEAGDVTDDGEILLFNDTTRSLLYTVEEHAASQAFSTFKMSGYPANFLNAGECIFAVDSTAGATWMGTDAPLLDISADRIVEFETAVYPVPQFDPAHPKMISQGPSLCIFNKADRSEVMASWIFAQYLLTSPVQIAYSSTEGYVPVTLRAQQSAEYQDYLSRAGEDDAHYAVKIAASRLLLEHMEDTFVTPVFNGSASLRSAAGQLIENAVKAGRRSQPLSDESIEQLYADVRSLYRLDSQSGMQSGGELGPLPAESRALLIVLGCVWIGLGAGLLEEKLRRGSKNASKKSQ